MRASGVMSVAPSRRQADERLARPRAMCASAPTLRRRLSMMSRNDGCVPRLIGTGRTGPTFLTAPNTDGQPHERDCLVSSDARVAARRCVHRQPGRYAGGAGRRKRAGRGRSLASDLRRCDRCGTGAVERAGSPAITPMSRLWLRGIGAGERRCPGPHRTRDRKDRCGKIGERGRGARKAGTRRHRPDAGRLDRVVRDPKSAVMATGTTGERDRPGPRRGPLIRVRFASAGARLPRTRFVLHADSAGVFSAGPTASRWR